MGAAPYRVRHIVAALVLLSGFAVVLFRLFNLHILQAAELTVKADRQHRKAVTVQGPRGSIYDRHGKVLAINMDVPSVFGVPASLENPSGVARDLAPVLHVRAGEIEKKLRQDRSFVWIARKLDPEQGRRLERMPLEGIGVVMEGQRFYPKGSLLSHVLGFAGMDSQGLEGLERRYDPYLRGEKQMVVLQRDALGRTVFPKGLHEQAPSAGRNVILTIDEVIQYIAEKELEEAVTATRAKGGIVIVMEPRTGAILAMAVNPRFDPNAVQAISADRWRNRALTDAYEPGSTMKIFVAAAALEEKVMEPGTLVYGENGHMAVANTVIHDHERLGWLTFAQVIQRSSNIGSVKTALALGEERLYRWVRAFGFGERTEIDLPGEMAGLVKEPRDWGRRSLASIAIGQEIGVTPLQLVTAVAAIANGGWLMKPYTVSEIRDGKGRVVVQVNPQVRRQPVSPETVHALSRILEGVVAHGTGTKAAIPGYRVAGKTGTAQKIDPKTGAYSSNLSVGSFVGYVPAEDPRLAIVVVIDEPQTEAWGGVVAAPVFRRVAEQALPYLGVSSQEPVKLALVISSGVERP
ncbi:MAG TPA: penicillin-binding protein 2 [Nitrospiraceae bacterium]|nr:penicillin-binding protein 2 [Nitrospiraceae bacterium]